MGESEKKQVIQGAFWKFAERIAAQLVSLVVSIVLARLLSPTEYGTISLVMVFITIANVFVNSGFGQALIQKKKMLIAWIFHRYFIFLSALQV